MTIAEVREKLCETLRSMKVNCKSTQILLYGTDAFGEQSEQPFTPNDNINLSDMLKARIRDFSNVNEVNWLYYEISNIELDDMKQISVVWRSGKLKSFVDYSLIVSAKATTNDIKSVLASKLKRDSNKIRLLCVFHNRIAKVFQNNERPSLEECKFLVAEENDMDLPNLETNEQTQTKKEKGMNEKDTEMKETNTEQEKIKQTILKQAKDIEMTEASNDIIIVEVVSVLKYSLSEFIGHPFLFPVFQNEHSLNDLESRLKRKLGLSEDTPKNWSLCVMQDDQIIPIQDKQTQTNGTQKTEGAVVVDQKSQHQPTTNSNQQTQELNHTNTTTNTSTTNQAVATVLTSELFSHLNSNEGRCCLVMVHEESWNNIWTARKLSSRNKGSNGGSLLING